MKRQSTVMIACLLLCLVLAACGGSKNTAAGKTIYQRNCVPCHGEQGMGDGPTAGGLNPKPQPLAANQEGLEDAYIFWRISEGGLRAPFSSSMPSWKAILSEQEIWQVISYLRTMMD
jgi:mono/diheme cytochrome c family protein